MLRTISGNPGTEIGQLAGKRPRIHLTIGEKGGYLTDSRLLGKGGIAVPSEWIRLEGQGLADMRGVFATETKPDADSGMDQREVMNIRQASQYLGVSPDTLYKYLSQRKIPAFKLGNRWRFKKSTLDGWMERQSHSGDYASHRRHAPA